MTPLQVGTSYTHNYKLLECFVTLGTHSQLRRGRMSHICDISPLKVKHRLKLWNYSPYLVVMFNMESICCFSKSWCVIQVSQISPHVGIVNDAFFITLKPIKTIMTILNILFQESVNPPILREEDLHSTCSTLLITYMYTCILIHSSTSIVMHVHVHVQVYW